MNFLEVSSIQKTDRNFILKDINFTQQKFEKIAIAGETGSGKSSLLKIIAGWIPPDSGQVLFEGERVKKVPAEKLIPGHPGIAYLSQQFELPNFLTVSQVLEYANTLPAAEAIILFDLCRIGHLLSRRTDQLSGGEKQRIALARLLTSSPRLLLLDEPFSNMDLIHKNLLKEIIRDISEQLQITCMLVSHEAQDVLSWAHQVLVMKEGMIVQQDTPENIYRHPVNEYVAGLFGKYYRIDPALAAAFAILDGTNIDATSFFRAEHFKIAGPDQTGIEGRVTNIFFLGYFYEIEVSVMNNLLMVRSESANFQINEVIYVRLDSYGSN